MNLTHDYHGPGRRGLVDARCRRSGGGGADLSRAAAVADPIRADGRQPILPAEARHHLHVPREARWWAGHRRPHRHARHQAHPRGARHGGPRSGVHQGRPRRGHQGLVRPGRPRERLVLRGGHREVDHGTVTTTAGSWQAGVDGAKPGIFMPATPRVGQVFKQEDAPGVAEDCTRIADLAASVKSPFVKFYRALKTEEFSLLEPEVLDNKYYVRRVGVVREQTVIGGDEALWLVNVQRGG